MGLDCVSVMKGEEKVSAEDDRTREDTRFSYFMDSFEEDSLQGAATSLCTKENEEKMK